MVVTGQVLRSFGTRRLFKILGNEVNDREVIRTDG